MLSVQDKSLEYCNHSSIKWSPQTTPTIWQGASCQMGTEMGHSGVCSWVIHYFCHIPGDEGLKKKRHVLSFLNTLPSLSVHGCAYLWLLLMDATARHSFQSFSESVLGDSIALGAGDKNEQDRQGAYSQGTFSQLETALNKDSIWLIIRIHRFCKKWSFRRNSITHFL